MSSNLLQFVLPLSSDLLDLPSAGGKGANLARLVRAGFPVPNGFIITTPAYTRFVAQSGLEEAIQQELDKLSGLDPTALETASACIREHFHQAPIPGEIEDQIRAAYAALSQPPVAVRSSATAEDLPDFSFAGQQDTFLNVIGPDALLDAVRRCWSSLWTARAIGYRARNQVPASGLSLAVVVQMMVPSQASGVMFTAHPLSGKRTELAIDAIFGLGEALVSGQSEPDQFVVGKSAPEKPARIVSKKLGSKAVTIQGLTAGGTETLRADSSTRQALSDEQVLALAHLGEQVEAEYGGAPQDIEWGLSDDQFYLLQSRAITSLYPLLEGIPLEPLQVYGALSAIQGMNDPFTPFGREAMRVLVVNVANRIGFKTSLATTRAFHLAGERLFINFTHLLRNRIGRAAVLQGLKAIEPSIRAAILPLLDDPALQPGKRLISPRAARNMLGLLLPVAARMLITLLRPDWRRQQTFDRAEAFHHDYEMRFQAARTLAQRLDVFMDLYSNLPRLMIRQMIPTFAPGIAMLNALHHLAGGTREDEQRILEVTRGMPYNVTTQMDLALWEVSRQIKADRQSTEVFETRPAQALSDDFLEARLPSVAQEVIRGFLAVYGARGLCEIDLGRVRWRENPTPLMQAIQSYMSINDPQAAPDATFERGRKRAEQAINELCESARQRARNPVAAHLRPRQIRFAARRVRALSGLRELPKFLAIRLMGLIRYALLNSGQELVQAGLLDQPQDMFFLLYAELRELATAQSANGQWPANPAPGSILTTLKERVSSRRQAYDRERLRRQVPVLLLSDGRAFIGGPPPGGETNPQGSAIVTGTPVSPGQVEGRVRVVFNPHEAGLQHGEILVCPGTDPSWTPLFMAAGGLVMEVGGLMTHGSVVAREYGIPAVVGVHRATQRLYTGQRIRVDGSSGTITLLDQVETKGDTA